MRGSWGPRAVLNLHLCVTLSDVLVVETKTLPVNAGPVSSGVEMKSLPVNCVGVL